MSEVGSIFSYMQGGLHLVVLDCNWALERVATHEVIARASEMPDYAASKQCALMCARVYVPDFYMLDSASSGFPQGLLEALKRDDPEFKEWLREHHQEVVNAYLTTLGDEGKGHYKLEDLLAFGRRQFTQYLEGGA